MTVAVVVAVAAVAALLVLVAVLRRRFVVVTVVGASMSPTLRPGQRVLVRRSGRGRRGEVVVFAAPDPLDVQWLVKRVAAEPGDPVPGDLRAVVTEEVVPAGAMLVRGDNPQSLDSRRLGLVPTASLIGVVVS